MPLLNVILEVGAKCEVHHIHFERHVEPLGARFNLSDYIFWLWRIWNLVYSHGIIVAKQLLYAISFKNSCVSDCYRRASRQVVTGRVHV
jgi:hypothetical protein